MSKPKKKPPHALAAAAANSRKQATPVRRIGSRPTAANDNDDDDDDDDDDLEVASALRMFLRRPPTGADHAVVTASTPQGDQVVRDCSVIAVRADASGLASECADACDRWARSEGREVRFRVQWLAGERVLGTHQWRVGDGDPQALDGTVESFLSQQQRHAETQHRLYHDGYEMVQEGWRTLLKAANERIKSLEADNAELRDRLRKVDDVSSEIALASAQADLDARGRTADILEQRVLPIAQALLLQHANKPQPSAAVAAAADNDVQRPK